MSLQLLSNNLFPLFNILILLNSQNERSIELIHEFSEDFDFLTPAVVDFEEDEDNDERDHSNSTDASRSSENSTSDDGDGL